MAFNCHVVPWCMLVLSFYSLRAHMQICNAAWLFPPYHFHVPPPSLRLFRWTRPLYRVLQAVNHFWEERASLDRFTSCLCFTHLLCLPLFMEKGAVLVFQNIPVKKEAFCPWCPFWAFRFLELICHVFAICWLLFFKKYFINIFGWTPFRYKASPFLYFQEENKRKKCYLVQLIHAVLSSIFLLSSISVDSWLFSFLYLLCYSFPWVTYATLNCNCQGASL